MRLFRILLVIALLGIVNGCASHAPAADWAGAEPATAPLTRPTTRPAATTMMDMKDGPFMFNEASLPQGFPPPGPVGKVIVKRYPPSRAAVAGGDPNRAFRPLFDHIKKNGIAMSAPVEITWSDGQDKAAVARPVAMAFVYRDPTLGSPGVDGDVNVIDVPAQTYLSVGLRGSYNQDHLLAGEKSLREWLATRPGQFKVVGPPRYLGYNSPFVPWFMRYGEVQLPVTPATTQP
jgi:hypothetical protein